MKGYIFDICKTKIEKPMKLKVTSKNKKNKPIWILRHTFSLIFSIIPVAWTKNKREDHFENFGNGVLIFSEGEVLVIRKSSVHK